MSASVPDDSSEKPSLRRGLLLTASRLLERIPTPSALTITILVAFVVGIAAGIGALLFNLWIWCVGQLTFNPLHSLAAWTVVLSPVIGMIVTAWLTRRFAPEAQGHGVPEVIGAVARRGGVIHGRVASIKLLASGVTIGSGGSAGSEGPIVQIGAAVGSTVGQWLRLPERNLKVLVASGAAGGISATFGAPLAGVMFASEVILGNFAVTSLTPIVIAAVIANLVFQIGFPVIGFIDQERMLEGIVRPVFYEARDYTFEAFSALPLYILLGLLCGLVAVGFTKFLYASESVLIRRMPNWFVRAAVCGLFVGVCGLHPQMRSLYGVGYDGIRQTLEKPDDPDLDQQALSQFDDETTDHGPLALHLLLLLILLKYVTTSVTLGGGGSGGIFAPSLYLGALFGALVGHLADPLFPGMNLEPGAFAVVGMASVVAGTTHGPISAVLILFEMTQDYNIILPLMCASGLASVVARAIDPDSIYLKKLARRGELTAWGHHTTGLEDIYVRDLMIRNIPTVSEAASLEEIVETALFYPHITDLPVMSREGKLLGVIGAEDLHRVLDTNMQPSLVRAVDIVSGTPTTLTADENLLDALRDFGEYDDVQSLPVVRRTAVGSRLIGLLPRSHVMRRYRQELLKHQVRHN